MKQRIFSTPPVSTERENRQRSRWLGLLLMFVFTSAFLVPSQQARAANAWEWPKFWATDLDVTPDDPAIAFEASYLNYDGNNFYWRTLDLVVDGVNIGSIGRIMNINNGYKNDDPINWNTKSGWYGDYFVKIDGFRQGDDKWKYMTVHVYFPTNYYGQVHTVGIQGEWVDKDQHVRNITPDNLKITSKTISFTTPSGCGSYERTAPGKLTWTPSNSVTAASGYGHKYEYRLNDVGNWITNSNPNASFGLSGVSNAEQLAYHTRYVQYKSFTQASKTITINFIRDWDKTVSGNIVRACIAPKQLETNYDQWKKVVTLDWQKEDASRLTNGKFYVFKYTNGNVMTRKKLGDFNYGSNLHFVDDDIKYGDTYTYEVSSILDNWTNNEPVSDLTVTSPAIPTTPHFEFSNFEAEPRESSVLLTWKHDKPTNNTQLTFKVWRCLYNTNLKKADGTIDIDLAKTAFGTEPIATVTASSQGTTSSYEDFTPSNKNTRYVYAISVEAMENTFYSQPIGPTTIDGNTVILSMSANRGTYTNVVKLQWDVKQVGTDPTRYIIYRRLLGSKNDEDFQQIHVASGTESSYYFEDNTAQPGQFYQYRIVAQSKYVDDDNNVVYDDTSTKMCDGFCQSRGVISGRITYGTGTAVPDARVLLTKVSDDDGATNQFYSMKIDPQGGIVWAPKATAGKALFEGKPFTFQMYVRPETVVSDGSTIIDGGGQFALQLKPAVNNQSQLYLQVGSSTARATGLKLANGAFHNISLTCDGTTHWTVRMVVTDSIAGDTVLSKSITATSAITWSEGNVVFGSDKDYTTTHAFTGYLDDIRLWSKALTDEEILDNYDRLLVGTEPGLKLYWPMDEGVASLPFAYDYSKTSGVANENHGEKQSNTSFSDKIPAENQLRLYSKTDTEGNYVIRGVPFAGEGTSYMVRPMLGIHGFSPQYQTRYVNMEALTHNGVDFEDVSSFPVSGAIYYSNTDYPVEGVNLYVDGTICAKDGKAVVTDAQGKFTISVPIGDHYITVEKQGHTFELGGRYPDDEEGIGKKFTFDSKITGIEFYDNTLVTVAGRVVGGDTEGNKPLGMALSTNNIGQARVTLSLQEDNPYRLNVVKVVDGTTSEMQNNTEPLAVASPTTDVESTAYRTGGSHSTDVKSIVIETDPQTGEFAVLVPPLLYKVTGIEMVNGDAEATFAGVTFSDIDATNAVMEYTDTTDVYQGIYTKEFKYNARLAQTQSTYYCTPTFEVWQDGRDDGLFGDNEAIYFNQLTGKNEYIPAIADNAYVFGYPLFEMNRQYKFKLKGYEQYTNNDDENDVVTTIVPLKDAVVTIDNQMSADHAVAAELGIVNGVEYRPGDVIDLANQVEMQLNEKGEATYTWNAGFPNIYDDLTRPLAINYEYNGKTMPWTGNPFKGIILGALPSGSNFVTAGPDKVTMILRDPAGSGSSASWEKGSSHSTVNTNIVTTESNNVLSTVTHFGVELENAAGSLAFYNISKMESKRDFEAGLEMSYSYEGTHSTTTTTTTTKTISTSDSPDFVGADGDVFIGTSTNLLFGNARQVMVKKAADGTYSIASEDGLMTSTEFDTEFSYTQYYIENTLIPNLIRLRNDLLVTVDTSTYQNYKNTTDEVKYITLLDESDERFGSDNADEGVWKDKAVKGTFVAGPSYRAVIPEAATDDKLHQDMVHYYNESIRNWKAQLALNEKQKLQVINDRQNYLINNFSFDGGTSVDYSVGTETANDSTYTDTYSIHLVTGGKAGVEINKQGVEVTFQTNTGSGQTFVDEEHGTTSEVFSFSLHEEGDDALSLDAFNSPDNFAPIFVTRGGQTSCPYEDETVTKYYQPGTSIGAATMKIEDPQLSVVDAKNVLSDVPRGGKAVFYLKMENLSETNSDGQFNLKVVEGTNPNGALLSLSTGPLGNGHTFIVKSGEALTIPLTLQQNNTDVYDYENIGLSLQSDCQGDMESVVYLTAHFVPSSSDVMLMADKSVLNTSVGDVLTLSVRDYDTYYENLKAIRVQYKGERDANWSTIPGQEYYVDDKYAASNNQKLPDGGVITVQFPMENYVDGTYMFRAQTATAYGNQEITKESDVVTVIKDMKKPQLFGLANPSDGVLNAGDEISVTFNEDIRQSMLTETNNFKITAALNGQQVAHNVALDGQATECAAKTEASINLARRDFSADMWINYTGAGTLLSHGNGSQKFDVATDSKGRLVVKIGDETYKSGKSITPNKWVFLTLNYRYNGDGGVLNAMFADDASETMLFTNKSVAAYEGSGALAVGKKMTGAIHELTLWDMARDCADAQAEMYYTKKPSTPGLIGYWKFDEGDGLTATDYARNRHMTLAGQTWYVNNENKAVTLSGSNAVKLNISECNALPTEDYALELWFKSEQTGKASLFSTGNSTQAVEMGFGANGALTLTSNGQTRELTPNNYRDNAWHHMALNVLRSGYATVYVDGTVVSTMPASAVASLTGSELVVGASKLEANTYKNFFNGSIDEVRYWKATLTGEYLNRQKSTRLTGEEDGLVAYYPFEHKELDDHNQVVTTQSVADQHKVCNKTTDEYELTGHEASMTTGSVAYNATDVPRLKEAPTVTNIGFNFVANERSIVLKMTDDADRLEGTTVEFKVKAVLDANGNESDPIIWTAYVKQNQLLWQGDTEIALEQQSGESTSFEAIITNESGKSENWSLSGLPNWLTASATNGTLTAQTKKAITFTVDESTAIGKYEQTIYLTGNNNISEPLTLSLKVKGEEPDWAVNTSDYQFNMSIVGQLKFQDKLSTDDDDIVAAFNETGKCVGVARPQYESAYDSYFTMMTVYGNLGDDGNLLTFKAYDASTGKTYPVVETTSETYFEKDTKLGQLASPYIWNATDKIEQQLDLKAGWNWMSFYVTPDDMAPASMMSDALDILSIINGPTSTFEYDPTLGWSGTLIAMDNASMYKLNAKADGQTTIIGSPTDVANTPINVKKNALTWMGYPATFTLAPADAFADLDPQEDDMVKSQEAFAVYSHANAKWVGTLKALEPGKGYMYSSTATADKTFTYPATAPARGAAKVKALVEPYDYYFKPVTKQTYPSNMTMIGQVVENGQPVEGIEVAAFVDGECRATIVSDADGYLFLLVPGSKVSQMELRALIGNEEMRIDLPLTYQTDQMLGTLREPLMIDLNTMATGIARVNGETDADWYDLGGRKLAKRPQKQGIYIRGHEKMVIKNK